MGLSTPAPPQLLGLGNQCTLTRKHPWWVVSASRVWGGDLFGSLRGSINSTISLSLDPELLGRGRVVAQVIEVACTAASELYACMVVCIGFFELSRVESGSSTQGMSSG